MSCLCLILLFACALKKWDFFSFEVLKKKPEEEEPKPEKEPKPEVKPVPTPIEKIKKPEGTRLLSNIYIDFFF